MKIESIRISNFRCFGEEPVTINLEEGVTAFVGNNGSGKTAIFYALSRLFGITSSQRAVRKSDFHVRPTDAELPSGATMSIECLLAFPELDENGDGPAIPDVFGHMAASGEGEPLKARMRLLARWVDDGTPTGMIVLSGIRTYSSRRASRKLTWRRSARFHPLFLPIHRTTSNI